MTATAWTRTTSRSPCSGNCSLQAGTTMATRWCASRTLGFRGEALPSIGAAGAPLAPGRRRGRIAHRIRVEGGQVGAVEPGRGVARHPRGRHRPVLRHPGAAQIPQAPAHGGRARRARGAPARAGGAGRGVPAGDRGARGCSTCRRRTARARVAALLGPEAAALLPVEAERGGVRVTGFAGPPGRRAGHRRRAEPGGEWPAGGATRC